MQKKRKTEVTISKDNILECGLIYNITANIGVRERRIEVNFSYNKTDDIFIVENKVVNENFLIINNKIIFENFIIDYGNAFLTDFIDFLMDKNPYYIYNKFVFKDFYFKKRNNGFEIGKYINKKLKNIIFEVLNDEDSSFNEITEYEDLICNLIIFKKLLKNSLPKKEVDNSNRIIIRQAKIMNGYLYHVEDKKDGEQYLEILAYEKNIINPESTNESNNCMLRSVASIPLADLYILDNQLIKEYEEFFFDSYDKSTFRVTCIDEKSFKDFIKNLPISVRKK